MNIAVLPFENLGCDPDRAYLADGLTEEITAWLGQIDPDRLSVVSRTSATLAKREAKSLGEIGRELGADYLLESSIRAESGRVRITAKLIRARDQVQVWSQLYNRELTSMLGLQQELGAAIAEQIRFRLSPERFEALARREPRVAAAYDEYLRGLTFANQRTPATTQKAIEHYERATTLDPEYALAWSALAFAHSASAINSDVAPLEVRPRAREAARRAVRANPDLAEAHYALGYLNWILEWDWPAAETAFRRAIDLDPRYAWAHMSLGHLLSQSGRHSEALAAMRRARELDPSECDDPRPFVASGVSGARLSGGARPRQPGHRAGPGILDWLHHARTGVRAIRSARAGVGRTRGRRPLLRWQQQSRRAQRLHSRQGWSS